MAERDRTISSYERFVYLLASKQPSPIVLRDDERSDSISITRRLVGSRGAKPDMTPAEIRDEIIDILEDISPDEELDDLDDDQAFRDQLELDSMDFLDIVMELRKRHRVQIAEEDYGNLASMTSTVTYLEPKMKDIVKS